MNLKSTVTLLLACLLSLAGAEARAASIFTIGNSTDFGHVAQNPGFITRTVYIGGGFDSGPGTYALYLPSLPFQYPLSFASWGTCPTTISAGNTCGFTVRLDTAQAGSFLEDVAFSFWFQPTTGDGFGGISTITFRAAVDSPAPVPIGAVGLPGLAMALGVLVAWRRRQTAAA